MTLPCDQCASLFFSPFCSIYTIVLNVVPPLDLPEKPMGNSPPPFCVCWPRLYSKSSSPFSFFPLLTWGSSPRQSVLFEFIALFCFLSLHSRLRVTSLFVVLANGHGTRPGFLPFCNPFPFAFFPLPYQKLG